MIIKEEKYVDPREVKKVLEEYGDKENPLIEKTIENLEDLMDLNDDQIEKLKELIPEEVIYKIIEINPKNEDQVKLILSEKYRDKVEEVCKILFGEQ